jgi:hypothetical protein
MIVNWQEINLQYHPVWSKHSRHVGLADPFGAWAGGGYHGLSAMSF